MVVLRVEELPERRDPDVEAPELVAVDATDRLLLDTAAGLIAACGPGEVAVVDDGYGALTLGAVALHGAQDVRVAQDPVSYTHLTLPTICSV